MSFRTRDRDALAEHLKSQGVSTGLHYPLPVHLQKCYRDWGYGAGSLPVTERAAAEILSLPMFPGLTPRRSSVWSNSPQRSHEAPSYASRAMIRRISNSNR